MICHSKGKVMGFTFPACPGACLDMHEAYYGNMRATFEEFTQLSLNLRLSNCQACFIHSKVIFCFNEAANMTKSAAAFTFLSKCKQILLIDQTPTQVLIRSAFPHNTPSQVLFAA